MDVEIKKPILIFCSREICYYSADFFAARIADVLEEKGYQVIMQTLDTKDDLEEQLEQYMGKSYLAVLDFNSLLPRMELEDGRRYLDTLDAPFYNYIVDHPFYHHPGLDIELERYHAICIDEDHCTYMKKYYPHIKSMPLIPLGATKAIHYIPPEEKKEEILFIGTFNSSNAIYEQIKDMHNDTVRLDILKMVELLSSDETMSHEQAMKIILKDHGIELTNRQMKEHMNLVYSADRYLRNYFREKAVHTLIEAKIPVTVVGNGWEKSSFINHKFFHAAEAVDFSMSFQKIAQYAVSLNVSPLFRAGAHDRIFAAMANQSVCITDTNRFMEQNFYDGKELSLFSFHQKDRFIDQARELLENKQKRYEMADTALKHFDSEFSWEKRTEQIIQEFVKTKEII